MPTNFIENPETGKLYLIKRNKSGDPSKRFQPGTIVKFSQPPPHMATQFVTVHWLFDGTIEEDVLMFYGLVKDLTRKWLDNESARKEAESMALAIAMNHLDQLRFDPAHMVKITS